MLTGAINSAMTGVKTAQRVVDMASNNIANADTAGYKRLENKNFEIPGLTSVNAIGIGVGTNIETTKDAQLDNRMEQARVSLAEKVAMKESADQIAEVTTQSDLPESYSNLMNAAKDLAFDKNNKVLQTAFNEAGKQFSSALKNTASRLEDVKQQLEYKVNINDQQIKALQEQLSNITRNAPGDGTSTSVNALTQQLSMLTGTVGGYRKALAEIIPPVTAAYTLATDSVKADINTRFGQELLDSNNNWTSKAGNITALADSTLNDFGQGFGSVQALAGGVSAAGRQEVVYATEDYNNVQRSYTDTFGVDLSTETMRMMNYQKMYEANAKVLQVADQMLGTLIDIVAR